MILYILLLGIFMNLFLVALGGSIGSVFRYLLSNIIINYFINWKFPISTFIINISGCFIIGLLAGLSMQEDFFSKNIRLFLFTGICGGFTTFSAFGLETFYLIQKQEILIAFTYITLSIIIGLLFLAIGFYTFTTFK